MEDSNTYICDLPGCGKSFTKASWNQRFCGKICTRTYTNERILALYHERKNKDLKNRTCGKKGCRTVLSQYNEGSLCGAHEREAQLKKLKKWGFDVDGEDYHSPY